jgi:hypothetical protein
LMRALEGDSVYVARIRRAREEAEREG